MSFLELCRWIETTALSTAIREGALYYPILGALHLLSIAWFGGMVLMSDLRVLGIGLKKASAAELFAEFRRWKRVGFGLVLASGGLLWWAEPVVCYKSVSFRIKMVLLVLVGIHALTPRYGSRAAACVSLVLWFALIVSGRGIAFF